MAKKKKNTRVFELVNSYVKDLVCPPTQIKLTKSVLIKALLAYDTSLRQAIADKVSTLPTRVEEDEWSDDHSYIQLESVLRSIKNTE